MGLIFRANTPDRKIKPSPIPAFPLKGKEQGRAAANSSGSLTQISRASFSAWPI